MPAQRLRLSCVQVMPIFQGSLVDGLLDELSPRPLDLCDHLVQPCVEQLTRRLVSRSVSTQQADADRVESERAVLAHLHGQRVLRRRECCGAASSRLVQQQPSRVELARAYEERSCCCAA